MIKSKSLKMRQLANKKRRCGSFPHCGSYRRESLVAIENVQQLEPARSWFTLGRQVVVGKVREGEIDHDLKSRKQSGVMECREAQKILSRKSRRSRKKYADIVTY